MRWGELKDGGALWTIPGRRKNSAAHDVAIDCGGCRYPLPCPEDSRIGVCIHDIWREADQRPFERKGTADALMLQMAREEATEAGRDASVGNGSPMAAPRSAAHRGLGNGPNGHPVHVIEAVLNHRSGAISGVAAIYNRHSYLPEKRHALEAWASHVMGLANRPAASTVLTLRASH